MNNNEIKYYTRENGEKIPMKDVHTEHLINGLSKRYKDIFSSQNKDDFGTKLKEINDIKEEVYKRINDFNEKLGD